MARGCLNGLSKTFKLLTDSVGYKLYIVGTWKSAFSVPPFSALVTAKNILQKIVVFIG